jgi:hypothetical protein
MKSMFPNAAIQHFLGLRSREEPFYAVCADGACLFLILDLLGGGSSSGLKFWNINANHEGIKAPFCPIWFKSSPVDSRGKIYLLSNCGKGDFHLYRTDGYAKNLEFEEVKLPALTALEIDHFILAFDGANAYFAIEGTPKAYIVRNHVFEFSTPLELVSYTSNELVR